MDQTSDANANSSASSLASVASAGNIGVITLKNQAKRNALNHGMMHALTEAFARFAEANTEVALKWGIINHLVPSSELEAYTMEAARHRAAKALLAMAVVKEQLRVLCDYQPIPAQVFERIQDMRRKVYESGDYREGIAAFKEKRKPVFKGE
jgi:methylmalonyl-CoA decarboxylase